VEDSGQGIEPGFLPHVFKKFRRDNGTAVRRHGEMGIGLALVRQLAELQGSRVEAHSGGLGRGSLQALATARRGDARSTCDIFVL
jgi:signal transduction histidine kinase